MSDLTLYSMPSSGNSYKVRLLLALLGYAYRHVACENASPELADAKATGKAPLGKVPALELGNGEIIAESNAILCFLADSTRWLPGDGVSRAKVLGWMFFEQNRHEPIIAVRASLNFYPERRAQATPERMAELAGAGHAVLEILDDHLASREWFEAGRPTVADIALYAYTHTAGTRGGFEMDNFPAVNAWLARVASLPGYIGLDEIPGG